MMFFLFGHLSLVDKRFEMGYTPAEFKKTLQGQFSLKTKYANKELAANNWMIYPEDGDYSIEINIEDAPPRQIAMLTLPVLNAHFRFIECSDIQRDQFLTIFFKYFHKGGG